MVSSGKAIDLYGEAAVILNEYLKLPPLDAKICHGYSHACMCDVCAWRDTYPTTTKQPWEPDAKGPSIA